MVPMVTVGSLCSLGMLVTAVAGFDNMNGPGYVITKTPKAPKAPFNAEWADYENEQGGVDYFEMYVGPITSFYSQVWWAGLPTVDLPKDVVQKFDKKAIAIVGYEVDQVRKAGDKDVDGSILKEDVSLPINIAYNHHHDAYFTGAGSTMERVPYSETDPNVPPMSKDGTGYMLQPVEHTPSKNGLPTSAHLAAGNGGEYRRSYHGFASPTAYVIESPQTLDVVAMQIDTWNRDKMNITGSKYVPGPQSRNSGAKSRAGESLQYSGLLECPLSTRVTKSIDDKAKPFGQRTGSVEYFDPNPPPRNCLYDPCTPASENVGARNMTVQWTNNCEAEPRESLLQNKNPSCDLVAYSGGLQVCKHMWSLLDADQEIPWQDQPLRYYQKYRFYYQEYKPDFHIVSVPRVSWGIAAGGGHAEYDVPQCAPGTPVAECTHEIWGVVTPDGDGLHLAAIHMHCHAPTCLAMELWNNKTGELLCRQEPVYGGTGDAGINGTKYDEPGYIFVPPCLWGDAAGLEPMPLASGIPMMIKAITNSTYGHHGEMAFPEVTLVPWKDTPAFAKH